ncbi:unnamed protein product [Chrysodeixis includens]|uniref:C2H2-type domain-containing protein n=1 Tax=Chrysodeixis includens TaxID=689277 RepID=A0A9P0C3L3_CHRIL|nr:unnamed protein product [Chrysodeixis includens]
MNTSVEGIIVNKCQYAPIYLIQDPGATQANTYVLTPSTVDPPKPVSNNLKTFYENSGNIENGIINTDINVRPNAVKKKEGVLIGNNLKLASFLLPKTENVNKQYIVDNIVLKPNITTTISNPVPVNHHPVNTVPKIDIDRKIVKLKEVPIINRHVEKSARLNQKENTPSPTPSKHTSVQLIKLGGTYHSLNHLSNEQIKMVNQALKMFNDPDKTVPEPTYDPVCAIYLWVVSPKDLTVVAKKKMLLKDKKSHTKIPKRIEEKPVKQVIHKEVPIPKEIIEEEPEPPAEAKVTRSGRKVKLPKQILPEGSPQKAKKKSGTIVTCFQCSADFGSLYRLQKHYENHPTHIPAKIHSNLFHCLLAIIKSGSDEDKTNIFIQQLEQLIVKLKSLLPCLLRKVDGSEGQSCTINGDIGRLFGMNPGKYNFDVEALNCVKDKNGFCIHNPPKINHFIKDQSKPIPNILKHSELLVPESETENCARINSVAKWPTVSKRIWKLKQKTHEQSAKKMRLKSEGDALIDLGTEDFIFPKEPEIVNNTVIVPENNATTIDIGEDDVTKLLGTPDCSISQPVTETQSNNIAMAEPVKPKNNFVQFHSAHFDIRSSPIKTSSTVFRKFQIDPSKMSNYDVQVIRSLEMVNKPHDKRMSLSSPDNLHLTIPNSDSLHLPNLNNIHVTMPNSDQIQQVTLVNSTNSLHVSLPNLETGQQITIPNSNALHVSMPNSGSNMHAISNSENRLHVSMSSADNRLHLNLQNSNDLHVSKPNMSNSLHVISNSDNSLHASMPDLNSSLHIPNSNNNLHITIPNSDNRLHVTLPDSNDDLHVSMPSSPNIHLTLPSSNDSLHVSIPNDSLHDLFKDDLSCKDTDVIDPDLKDWIISTSEKSEDSFTKSNGLIEPSLIHVRDSDDKSMDPLKNVNHGDDMPSLDSSDNRLLSSQGESVLNFLDTLGNDLYPETEIRNNGVDFQLDLFAFHNS